ncbi:MAG: hypothetical protein ACFFA3_15935 [Promethearchaeota archaeon]
MVFQFFYSRFLDSLKHRSNVDSGISIQCTRSGEREFQQFTPEHLRSAIVSYEISLIHDPFKKVKEQCRITNRNIEYLLESESIILNKRWMKLYTI